MMDWQFLKIQAAPNLKKFKRLFKECFKSKGLDIIINCNMKIVNYLYVTLNLNNGSYRPDKKSNEETNYIHVNSDHTPSIKTTSKVNRKTLQISEELFNILVGIFSNVPG